VALWNFSLGWCSESYTNDYDDSIAAFAYQAASYALGCLPQKVFYQENTKDRVTVNSFVCAVEFGDKDLKAKSLLAGEIVVILNQNILMINRKCIKGAIQRRAFFRRCRKTERTGTILEKNTRRTLVETFSKGFINN
jgi:hypothetical protein